MAEQPSEQEVEDQLRRFLSAEIRQAEIDFHGLSPTDRRPARRLTSVGLLVAAVLIVVVGVVGFRSLDGQSVGAGGIPIGARGLPTSIDGEPVVSGPAIATRGPGDTFLAGGTLVLENAPDDWRLVAGPLDGPAGVFTLDGVVEAPGFVRTSGALTVAHVHAGHDLVLVVESIVWRQPTKGPVPAEATPPEGGETNDALWPDFVSVWGSDGVTIAGYVPKALLLEGGDLGPGSPSNPPQPKPDPVYGEDLTTLVGHMVPGVGFVALGSAEVTARPEVTAVPASVAPSAVASKPPEGSPPAMADCGRITRADVCAKTIELARRGRETEVVGATRIVVDDTCPPASMCDRLYPFDAIVVFVTAGADTTGWYAVHVFGRGQVPTTAEPWLEEVPAHVVQRLRELQSAG